MSTVKGEEGRRRTFTRELAYGVIAVVALVFLTAALGLQGLWRLYNAQENVLRSHDVVLGTERLLALVRDAESGQRGYIITGNAEYLDPYASATSAFGRQFRLLEDATRDSPAQAARLAQLKGLSDKKFQELAQTIDLRRARGFEAAQEMVLTNLGMQTMALARAKAAEISAAEELRLREREAIRAQNRNQAVATIAITGLLATLMCAGFAWLLRRHLALQAKTAGETHRQKELFRMTLASIGDAVIATDVEGKVGFLNAVAQSMTGWSQADAFGRPLEEVFKIVNGDTRARVENPALRALREGAIVGLANHTTLIAKDGTERPIDDSAAPIRDLDHTLTGAVLVFRDISERKQAEVAIHDADRRKDEFLATLAHELRNPLAPLRTALQLARRTGETTGKAIRSGDLLDMMERQVDQMVRLVDDLLDVARITRGKLELRLQTTDLETVVNHALETCAPILDAGRHKVELSLPARHLYVEGDPARLSQVVCNLLHNAAKFSDQGAAIELAVNEEGRDAVLTVTDRGMGIPAAKVEEIFEMFSQIEPLPGTSKAGLGIGLTLARQIVQMHGGTISASSGGPGQGSRFTLRLPETAAPASVEPAPAAAQKEGRKMKIVIADDNRDSADSMAMLLEAGGHEVHVAYDGAEAVETANRVQPDAVLLDIGMPKMNGFECARAIRGQPWSAGRLLIALTGWGQEEDKRRALEAGFDRHLTKPVDPVTLEGALHPAQGGGP